MTEDEFEDLEPPEPPRYELAEILDELTRVVRHAKSMPLSSSAIITRDEVLDLLKRARAELPEQLSRARRVLADQGEVHAAAEREAIEILDEARAQAAHLVQRTEIVRQSRNQAERIITDAESEARRLEREADDYVDRKLAAFEIVLNRTIRTVQAGRERLAVVEEVEVDEALEGEGGFFDQDHP